MELGLASLGTIFAIVKAFNCDAVFSIDLGLTISLDLLLSSFTCYLNNSTFEMLLVV